MAGGSSSQGSPADPLMVIAIVMVAAAVWCVVWAYALVAWWL
jgi:hypothetical protein